MAELYEDFEVQMSRGDNKRINVFVKNETNTAPLNITGWTFWMTGKLAIDDADPGVFQRTAANAGFVIVDATGGQAQARLRPVDTSGLTPAAGGTWPMTILCDMQAIDAAGEVQTLGYGKVVVRRDVTRTAV